MWWIYSKRTIKAASKQYMQKQILTELKELKTLIAKVIGTSDLPVEQQFSIEAIDKAAKEFQKMTAFFNSHNAFAAMISNKQFGEVVN